MSIIEMVKEYLPMLLPGLWVSLGLLTMLVLVGTPMAFILASAQRSRLKVVRSMAIVVIEIARGMPSLILLYLVYFGLPTAGLNLEAFWAAVIALSLNYAGYVSQTINAGLEAIPIGQFEAANSLALGRWAQLKYIILPKSLKIITPPLLSWVIVYFQTTSVGFAIAVPEMMSVAYSVAAENFQYLIMFLLAGFIYASISIPGSQAVSWLENRTKSLR